ncbi:MAG: UDP-N-acetylglucosamine 1-carboxyvinyltransferase [Lachnospiraceae bacterium]|nr:UDP-N-acetylglucosamine 1-carboxyvinyltransferase [Lachnospiraceae bacterium]
MGQTNEQKLYIRGGRQLNGEILVDGAKNSALVCMVAACLVNDGSEVRLYNIPRLTDIDIMIEILRKIGKTIEINEEYIGISGCIADCDVPIKLASKIRGSIYLMGLLLGIVGKVKCGLPGGDKIGPRPIDMHLSAFEMLGAKCEMMDGRVEGVVIKELVGRHIYLKYPSVGTVCNIMLIAANAKGKTIIDNAAKEPEIVDLANMMIKIGIKVTGAGTDRIVIEGKGNIRGNVDYEIIPDRIETGVFLASVAMTGGEILIKNAITRHNFPLLAILEECGTTIESNGEGIYLRSNGILKPVNVNIMPFPGVATDLQPIITTLATKCIGESVVIDYVFPERFQYIYELNCMGARIERYSNILKINGGKKMYGAEVKGNDIRSATALVCAGLIAEGETIVSGVEHLLRGYVNLENKLISLGADIVKR